MRCSPRLLLVLVASALLCDATRLRPLHATAGINIKPDHAGGDGGDDLVEHAPDAQPAPAHPEPAPPAAHKPEVPEPEPAPTPAPAPAPGGDENGGGGGGGDAPQAPLPEGAHARLTRRAPVVDAPPHFPVAAQLPRGGGGGAGHYPRRPESLLVYDVASGNEFLVEFGENEPLVALSEVGARLRAAKAAVEEVFGEGAPWENADPNAAPYCSVGRLAGGCTGTLISHRLVVTAAHCLYDLFGNRATNPPSGAWLNAARTTFEPARHGAHSRPPVAPIMLIVPVRWTQTQSQPHTVTYPDGRQYQTYLSQWHMVNGVARSFDWGFVALAGEATTPQCPPQPLTALWPPNAHNQARELEVVGYPATLGRDGLHMKRDRCQVAAYHAASNLGENRCDTLPGNSGGPGFADRGRISCITSVGADRDSTGANPPSTGKNVCVMVDQPFMLTALRCIASYH